MASSIFPHLLVLAILSMPQSSFAGPQACGSEGFDPAYQNFVEALTFPNAEWREDDLGDPPSAEDQALLQHFLPRAFVSPNSEPLIDFYRDYLPSCVLSLPHGLGHFDPPNRVQLKRYERCAGASLALRRKPVKTASATAPYYGRVYRESFEQGDLSLPTVILKYNAAFAYSGLPAGLGFWRGLGSAVAGNRQHWHELDIHGAVHLIFFEGRRQPSLILLAQHNHFRTYIVGRDLDWPADDRVKIAYAKRSNEPYPLPLGKKAASHRCAANPSQGAWLVTGRSQPLTAAWDLVDGPGSGAVEQPVRLECLNDRDPLYVAWIPLGARERILGVFPSFYRQGPPGMNMNTWPELRRYTDIAQLWYFDDGDAEAARLYENGMREFFAPTLGPVKSVQGAKLVRALKRQGHLNR